MPVTPANLANPATPTHSAISGFFLGNASLHSQLLAALRVLECLKRSRKNAPTAAELASTMNLPAASIRSLMRRLADGGLLARQKGTGNKWTLSRALDETTLDDVYQCLTQSEPESQSGPDPHAGDNMTADLLLMQATMAINQSLAQQLRLFDLGRITIAGPRAHPAKSS